MDNYREHEGDWINLPVFTGDTSASPALFRKINIQNRV